MMDHKKHIENLAMTRGFILLCVSMSRSMYEAYNLLSSLLAIFSTRMAIEMIFQLIECYQFSCQFAVS